MNAPALDPKRWKALAIVSAAFLMTILDVSIVNVALPTIGKELHFSESNLQWIVTAYAITYGGFLLLGGRLADLFGRRRLFVIGVVVFTTASLLCGLSTSDTMLIIMRGIQGVGGALIAPAALSIVSDAFPQGAERNKALAVWGAIGGSGGAIGVLLGGILTGYLGWEWIFYVNVPIGVTVLALTPFFVRESRSDDTSRSFDPLGAFAITGSMILLVYSISKAPDVGWATGRTIGLLAAAVALLGAFVLIESRVKHPLLPLRIFRIRTVTGANVVGLLLGSMIYSMFFLLTLYAQSVLGFSALETGLGFLVAGVTAIGAAGLAETMIGRFGAKSVMAVGMLLFAGSLFSFSRIDAHGSYAGDLLLGLILCGLGTGLAFVPVSIVALTGVGPRDYGLASGLINTSQNIGGAIGLAVAATVFTTRFANELPKLIQSGISPQQATPLAMTSGFRLAFLVLAIVGLIGLAATLLLLRGVDVEAEAPDESHATCSLVPNRAATAAVSALITGDRAVERPGPAAG